jgi:uncharacterized repeat protein (TIGR01451 family)
MVVSANNSLYLSDGIRVRAIGSAAAIGGGAPPPSLTISTPHFGTFYQGEQGAFYTVTVSNDAAAGPTSSAIIVTDTLPNGLTLVSMSGNGWDCAANICSSGAVLAPGSSAPPITVVVNVGSGAQGQVINLAGLSGGGSNSAAAADSTTVAAFSPCDVTHDGMTDVSDIQREINEALGAWSPADDLNSDTIVNVMDVQIVINAALSLGCAGS